MAGEADAAGDAGTGGEGAERTGGGGAQERFDPRYDPAFQRGYRADSSARARSGRASRERAAKEERVGREERGVDAHPAAPRERESMPRERAPRERAPLASAPREPAPREPVPREPAPVASDPLDAGGASDGELQRFQPPRRGNPYIVALWIIGVGLVVTAVSFQAWAQSHSTAISYNSADGVPLMAVLLNLAYALSGPLVTVGLGTIVGLLFLSAVRRRRR